MWRLYAVTAKLIVLAILATGIFLSNESVIKKNEVQIVIVGAGTSGIAAATRLLERGIENIIILEAEKRIGGRMNTIKFGDAVIELGCQWVHGEEGNAVFSMASQHGLLMPSIVNIDGKQVFIDSSGNVINKNISNTFLDILTEIAESTKQLINYTESLGTYFTDEYSKKLEEHSLSNSHLAKPFLDWYHKGQNIYDASDSWFITSGHGQTEYQVCEGSQTWAWKSGYSQLLDLLMKKIPDPSKELPVKNKMKLNTEVVRIKWDNLAEENRNKIIVECSDGSGYIADHVIVTVSLGVLKEKSHALFQPKLSAQKLKAIKGLGFGTVDKILLKFPYKWWPDEFSEFSFLWTNNNSSCASQNNQKSCWIQEVVHFFAVDNQPLVLCGWITGTAARYMELLSDEEVKQESVQILNRFMGKAFNISIPTPDIIVRSSWSSNPNFRGSYSFGSMETEALQASAAQLAEPVTNDNGKDVLLFAGEATHSYYYATVHGAVETGWREADRLLKFFESQEISAQSNLMFRT